MKYFLLILLNYGLLNFFVRLAYGFRAHLLNLGSYCLGLLPMTFLVINIKPGMAFNSTGIINETSDHSEILDTKVLSTFQFFKIKHYQKYVVFPP